MTLSALFLTAVVTGNANQLGRHDSSDRPPGSGSAVVTYALKSQIPPCELNPSFEKWGGKDKKKSKSHITVFKESIG